MTQEETHYDRLRQRRDWLTQRIQAKKNVGWDVEYDTAERDALTWALEQLDHARVLPPYHPDSVCGLCGGKGHPISEHM